MSTSALYHIREKKNMVKVLIFRYRIIQGRLSSIDIVFRLDICLLNANVSFQLLWCYTGKINPQERKDT